MGLKDVQFFPYKGEKLPDDFEYDSEYKPLVDFFEKDAKSCTDELVSKIFIIKDEENNFIGFVAFTIKSIKKNKLVGSKTGGKFERPALVIGQLMIDKKHQRKRFGRTVIKFAISIARRMNQLVPCRLMVVEAFDKKAKKYYEEKLGFESTPDDENTLVLDLLPILSS